MAIPTCAELKEKYFELLLGGGEVLIKSGDQLVKYTDIGKLASIIEQICGPLTLEGSTAFRGIRMHGNRVSDPSDCGGGCGGCGSDDGGFE